MQKKCMDNVFFFLSMFLEPYMGQLLIDVKNTTATGDCVCMSMPAKFAASILPTVAQILR